MKYNIRFVSKIKPFTGKSKKKYIPNVSSEKKDEKSVKQFQGKFNQIQRILLHKKDSMWWPFLRVSLPYLQFHLFQNPNLWSVHFQGLLAECQICEDCAIFSPRMVKLQCWNVVLLPWEWNWCRGSPLWRYLNPGIPTAHHVLQRSSQRLKGKVRV